MAGFGIIIEYKNGRVVTIHNDKYRIYTDMVFADGHTYSLKDSYGVSYFKL